MASQSTVQPRALVERDRIVGIDAQRLGELFQRAVGIVLIDVESARHAMALRRTRPHGDQPVRVAQGRLEVLSLGVAAAALVERFGVGRIDGERAVQQRNGLGGVLRGHGAQVVRVRRVGREPLDLCQVLAARDRRDAERRLRCVGGEGQDQVSGPVVGIGLDHAARLGDGVVVAAQLHQQPRAEQPRLGEIGERASAASTRSSPGSYSPWDR